MNHTIKAATIAFATAIGLVAAAAPAVAADGNTKIIVQTSSGDVHASAGTGGTVITRIDETTALVSVPGMTEAQAVAYMRAKPGVVYAEPDIEYHATTTPDDPCYDTGACVSGQSQWAIDKIGLPSAWNVNKGRTSMLIGIVDSGVDVGHPDLDGRVTAGPNYSSDTDSDDDFGHGTHVAGIAGASTDNGIGIAGASWNARMLSIKVLNRNGLGTATGISRGIRYAADNGVRIVNLSLGATGYSQTMADAVAYAQARGVLVFSAADNQGSSTPTYPAALPGVIAVGASTTSDTIAGFSNYGTWVDLLAPGVNIVSTYPRTLKPSNPYEVESGTSMATPYASGVAALMWSEHPYLSAQGVAQRLIDTADSVAGIGTTIGGGRISASRALGDHRRRPHQRISSARRPAQRIPVRGVRRRCLQLRHEFQGIHGGSTSQQADRDRYDFR